MTSLDTIVCSYLINRQYPVHKYLHALKLATDCYRELHLSSLGAVKAVKLRVDDTKAVNFPNDYVDFVKIGFPVGQYVKPMASRNGITRLNEYDDNGEKTLHSEVISQGVTNGWAGYWYHNVINANGENVGRSYGASGGNRNDNFKIIKEQRKIQFNEQINTEYIVLEYISNGMEADNATSINEYTQACIEAYITWKMKDNNRSVSRNEVADEERKYMREWGILRARLADWTITDIMRIARSQYSIKG